LRADRLQSSRQILVEVPDLLANAEQGGPVTDYTFGRKTDPSNFSLVSDHYRQREPERRRRIDRNRPLEQTGLGDVEDPALSYVRFSILVDSRTDVALPRNVNVVS